MQASGSVLITAGRIAALSLLFFFRRESAEETRSASVTGLRAKRIAPQLQRFVLAGFRGSGVRVQSVPTLVAL